MSSLGTGNTVGKWELNIGLSELHAVDTLQVLGSNCGCADNLDGSWTGAVATGHFVVKLGDGSGQGNISEFTVHIVSTRSGRISQPDTVVLDDSVVLFDDLYAVQDFTGGLLHLSELVHVIPELGLGNHSVWCEDDHAVSLRVWDIIGGSLSAHNLKLLHNSGDSHSIFKTQRERNNG